MCVIVLLCQPSRDFGGGCSSSSALERIPDSRSVSALLSAQTGLKKILPELCTAFIHPQCWKDVGIVVDVIVFGRLQNLTLNQRAMARALCKKENQVRANDTENESIITFCSNGS